MDKGDAMRSYYGFLTLYAYLTYDERPSDWYKNLEDVERIVKKKNQPMAILNNDGELLMIYVRGHGFFKGQ